jgi:arylsulfatase A
MRWRDCRPRTAPEQSGWTRRELLEKLGLAAASLALTRCATPAPQARAAAAPRPNLVLILADDLGRECLGSYGGTSYPTPALDRLAAEGMRFERCFAMPKCHPSRVTLLTGRYPFRTNSKWGTIPDSERTFGHVLSEAGYATALSGKWQMAKLSKRPDHVAEMGFQTSATWGWREGPLYLRPLIFVDGERRQDLDARFGPDVHTDFLIDFIAQPRSEPFLAYFPMTLVHYSDRAGDAFPPDRRSAYPEMMAELDLQVGRLLDALDRLGHREDTLVLFTADNGTPQNVVSRMGEREVRGGKALLTDAGTHVPLIARWPGVVPAGTTCSDLIDLSDFLPTLAELGGAEPPAGIALDGRSFAPQLLGRPAAKREWVCGSFEGRSYLRGERWKLYTTGELFDLDADPDEHAPIAAGDETAEAAAARATLLAGLVALDLTSGQPGEARGIEHEAARRG